MLIAELADTGFEGFIETDTGFTAYVEQPLFNEVEFEKVLEQYHVDADDVPRSTIEQQNWNAQWEASFEPITIGNEIIVKAPFHLLEEHYTHEIIIQPKNTFGTGHHETTQLILQMMLQFDFNNKSVFDYGCGTGVLGIFASKLGASTIFAIDIDEWSAENIGENCALNSIRNIEFKKGDLSIVEDKKFDMILANINKNILLSSFAKLTQLMNEKATLLISGFYENDLDDLKTEAEKNKLTFHRYITKNNWCVAEFSR